MRGRRRWAAALATVGLLAACGRGDDDAGGSPAPWPSSAAAVVAVDALTGSVRWTQETTSRALTVAAVSGDRVLVSGRDEPCGGPARLEAFARSTGERSWERDLEVDGFGLFSLAVADDVVAVPGPGHVVGLDVATGAVRWDTPVAGAGVVAGDGDLVVATGPPGSGGVVTGLDAASGRVRWTRDLGPGRTNLGLGLSASLLVAQSFGPVFAIETLAWSSGDVGWTADLAPSKSFRQLLRPAADRIVVETDQSVVALDAATGDRSWTAPGPLITAGGSVAITVDAEGLAGLDAADGAPRWTVPGAAVEMVALGPDVPTTAAPTGGTQPAFAGVPPRGWVLGDAVLIASLERVHALDAASGTERWSMAVPMSFVTAARGAEGPADVVLLASDPDARCSS